MYIQQIVKPKRFVHYYNGQGLSLAQVYEQMGCDMVFPTTFFNPDGTQCYDLRVDGKTIKDDEYTHFGFVWNKYDNTMRMDSSGNGSGPWMKYDNFATCIPLIKDGKKLELYCSTAHKTAKRGQFVQAFLTDGRMLVYGCLDGDDAKSRIEIQEMLYQRGDVVHAISWDGGRTVGCYSRKGNLPQLPDFGSTRPRGLKYIMLVWFDKEEPVPTDQRERLVATAKKYLNQTEANKDDDRIIDKYNAIRDEGAYKVGYNDPWCASFVSVMANEAGLSKLIPPDAYCPFLRDKIKGAGGKLMSPQSYTPKPGDIIFYDWQGDTIEDHVGIVTECDGNNVTIIEGNYNNSVKYRTLAKNLWYIKCYAVPAYNETEVIPMPTPTKLIVDGDFGSATEKAVKAFQSTKGLTADGIAGPATFKALLSNQTAQYPIVRKGSRNTNVLFLQALLNMQ